MTLTLHERLVLLREEVDTYEQRVLLIREEMSEVCATLQAKLRDLGVIEHEIAREAREIEIQKRRRKVA